MYRDKDPEVLPILPTRITPMVEPWQQTLLEAAHWLRKYEWCQHHYRWNYGHAPASCLVGAVYRVGTDVDGMVHLAKEAKEKVREYIGDTPEEWNDKKGRTKEQVIHLLEVVALGV